MPPLYARHRTTVLAAATLFARFGSAWFAATAASLASADAFAGRTTIVTCAVSEAASAPTSHLTARISARCWHEPRLGAAATNATPAGSRSTSVTAVAPNGPAFRTWIAYVSRPP